MMGRSLIYKCTINMADDNSARSLTCRFVEGLRPRVLDVGCACGDLGVAIKANTRAELYGLELNAESVAIARKSKAYRRVIQINLDDLTVESFPAFTGKFDYVLCADVLEHLRDPMRTLSILKTYLKPTGHVIASIPNVAHMSIKANLLVNDFTYTPIGLLDCTHIHLFTHKSIASGLSQIGLAIDQRKFTMHHKTAWQPNDPYPELPRAIKRFLFKDWHSYVCQYVLRMSPSTKGSSELEAANRRKLALNVKTAPQLIVQYRARLMAELSPKAECGEGKGQNMI